MSESAVANSAQSEARHILIVDDDTRIRSLLQKYLSENGYRVTAAGDAADARARLSGLSFDLIILDVMMPGEDGIALTRSLRETSDVPVLLLTARGEAKDRIAGLESGADDYLPKPFEPRELLLRIGTILRRAKVPGPPPVEVAMGKCRFNIERGELTRAGASVRLTSAEVALLRILAAEPGKAFSRMDLSARTSAGLERSIDVQVTRLRRKIEEDPRTPIYLQTVRGIGYMLLPDRLP
ncbi:MAG: response regulator [Alphaproteobacteria bacterium]|nr:response regulator [Alphaproteobacteria bacterium]